jgi:hypothetical protein
MEGDLGNHDPFHLLNVLHPPKSLMSCASSRSARHPYAHRLVSTVTYDSQADSTLILVVDCADQSERSTDRFIVDPTNRVSGI